MRHTIEMLICPSLVFYHFLNQLLCLTYLQGKECPSGGSIKLLTGLHWKSVIEILDEQPILHSMMRAYLNILLESLPCLQNKFSGLLLEVRNFATKKIGFTDGEELDEEVIWTLPPRIQGSRVGIEPMLCLFEQWERKKSESNGVLWDSSNWNCVANL